MTRERAAATCAGPHRGEARTSAPRRRTLPAWLAVATVLSLASVFAGCSVSVGSGDTSVVGSGPRITGSGEMSSNNYDVKGFTGVQAGTAFDVTVTRGDAYKVNVTVDDNVVKDVRVTREGGTLHISLDPGKTYVNVTMKAAVQMPEVRTVDADAASTVHVVGFTSAKPLRLKTSGGADMTLASVRAGDVALDVSGGGTMSGELEATSVHGPVTDGSTLSLRGAVSQGLTMGVFDGSDLDLGSLAVKDADVQLSDGSTGHVDASGTLNAQLSDGSDLTYTGDPSLGKISSSDGSQISAGN